MKTFLVQYRIVGTAVLSVEAEDEEHARAMADAQECGDECVINVEWEYDYVTSVREQR